MARFLPYRSANHPPNTEPMNIPRKELDVVQPISVTDIPHSFFNTGATKENVFKSAYSKK